MLGLTVLFFFVLWVLFTLFATRIGSKMLKNRSTPPYAGVFGGFLGFMLTMGGFIVYWAGEFVYIQYKVNELCQAEAGIEEYVSVDEFKQRLATNNWEGVPTYTVLPKGDVENEEYILFQGKEFRGMNSDISIPKIDFYENRIEKNNIYSTYIETLYTFNKKKASLLKYIEVRSGVGAIANDLSALKFWLNNIEDCSLSYEITDTKYLLYKEELKNAQ